MTPDYAFWLVVGTLVAVVLFLVLVLILWLIDVAKNGGSIRGSGKH